MEEGQRKEVGLISDSEGFLDTVGRFLNRAGYIPVKRNISFLEKDIWTRDCWGKATSYRKGLNLKQLDEIKKTFGDVDRFLIAYQWSENGIPVLAELRKHGAIKSGARIIGFSYQPEMCPDEIIDVDIFFQKGALKALLG